ncbi:MAG: Gfo/Idh/MocA family oxidoreductase [bacterium]|jgi:predicted dehydrogenase|nr:Gfo/Idh/MocA family oxidoreductase [bacterium]
MGKKIGLAMVGCGQIAEAHLKAIREIEGAHLAWCIDAVPEQARSAAERYGATHFGTDYKKALSCNSVDAVVLCLPHDLHLPFSVEASQAGKHVLVEKPMALDEAEAARMVAEADRSGTQISVGQSTRFMPTFQAAKREMATGCLGRVVNIIHQRMFRVEKVSTEWRKSMSACGGLYLPLFGSHDVDAILWLLDDQPSGVWGAVRASGPATEGDSDGFIGLEFADGKICSLAFSLQSRHVRTETVLVGETATLIIRRDKLLLDDRELPVPQQENSFVLQMRQFVEALSAGQPTPTQGWEVLRVMRTLDLARQSSESGVRMVF